MIRPDWRACSVFLSELATALIVVAGVLAIPSWAAVQILMWLLTTGG